MHVDAQSLLQVLDCALVLHVVFVPQGLLAVHGYEHAHHLVLPQEPELLDGLYLGEACGDGVVHHQQPLPWLEVAGAH